MLSAIDPECAAERSPSERVPQVGDSAVRDLAAEIEARGFAVLPDYLGQAALEKLQAFARRRVLEAGGEYTAANGREAVSGTLLADLPDQPEFVGLLRRLYEAATGKSAPRQAMHQVLRCLAGRTALKECFIFHYDSYVVTLLLPILIPDQGQRGDLLLWPNLRGVRPAYALTCWTSCWSTTRSASCC